MEDKLDRLIEILLKERGESAPDLDGIEKRRLFRALVNTRMPKPASEEFLQMQDEYLQEEIRSKGVTDLSSLSPIKPDIYLWKGDITTLKCDAIVNAANSQMLGCFCPNHGCIDNAIHTFAGVQLRCECYDLMTKQGYEEPVGKAKITCAYNLPCKYVLHTVGPIVYGELTQKYEQDLESCYQSCLALADEKGIASIAFCCISTGEFHFPNERASQIAIRTVEEYKERTHSKVKVIFNVFKEYDYEIYARLLKANN
ncbi:MAG: protein-ADP-ribose hydrolase [Clostridiales bacterium]|nr:protein-ADP-ribose hydrolase [Clostridiales bacterium]